MRRGAGGLVTGAVDQRAANHTLHRRPEAIPWRAEAHRQELLVTAGELGAGEVS